MADPKMVVVDGIRYRPEDAPKRSQAGADASAPRKARKVANKSRTPRDKTTRDESEEDTPTDE